MTYERVPHRVAAEFLEAPWSWTNHRGNVMTARPGDYRLIDVDSGAQWSITPESLATGYVPLGDHNYESHGHVTAHQLAHDAQPEQVTSAEGEETAVAGDWIVTDDRGNSWVVSDDYFEANYRPVDDDIAR